MLDKYPRALLSVIYIIGLITVIAVAAEIVMPIFKLTPSANLGNIAFGGMMGLIALLKDPTSAKHDKGGEEKVPSDHGLPAPNNGAGRVE